MTDFESAATAAVAVLGAAGLRVLADQVAAGWPDHAILEAAGSEPADAARRVLAARASVPDREASALMRGVAAGYAGRAASMSVETVWSGPNTYSVPVRATAQVLVDVIVEAQQELILMTYSARQHEAIGAAIAWAIGRGVSVSVVVETLQGAGSALAGSEPAAAFAAVYGVELWHWPVTRRTETGAKMHAKVAIADRYALLVSSANLTQSGVTKNIEAGVLVRGGTAPRRAAEHVAELKAAGNLDRLRIF